MTIELPLVTVIAVCYNHERFVVECLESIRTQTYSNIQLIIMDDCSKDNSVEIISDWKRTHPIKCTLIGHQRNVGLPKTLNQALRISEGKYISIISTDDFWLPKFIENQIKVLEECGETYGLVFGRSYIIDAESNRLPRFLPDLSPVPEGNVTRELLDQNFIPANTAMIRRSCFDKVGFYDEELVYEDLDMWLRISQHYLFKFSPGLLANYRFFPSSFSRTRSQEMKISRTKIYLKQLGHNPEYADFINKRLTIYRVILYKIGHPLAKKYLWLGLKKKLTKTNLFMFICAVAGLHYSKYENIYHGLKRLINFIPG